MAKSSAGTAGYRCTECGWQAPKWAGRCGECQAWGTVEEAGTPRLARAGIRAVTYRTAAPVSTPAVPIGQVDATDARARPSGLDELDRVLGGGLVPGAVLLLAGEPGVGKSTLLLETGALVAEAGPVLYVTGEESAAQVRSRADRIGAVSDQLFLAAETDLDAVLGHVDAVEPRLLIIDSVQTIAAAGVEGSPGGVTQVRAVASALTSVAKERSMATILVGHVTKDGSVAGPRALEHLVDVVLHFDGDRHSQLRMVRAVKNRYGPTDEVGCFDLGEYGLIGLPDPSGLFLSQHREPVPGTCVTVTLEGRRPLPAEVQALVGNSVLEVPRRTTSGLDAARVGLVLAVLQRRAGLKLGRQDVYAATVGGVRLTEPSVDLAVAIFEPGNFAGVFGRLALAVVEIGGNRDDSFRNRLAEIGLGRFLHLLQNERADLRGRIFLAAALDPSVAIVAGNDLVRDKIHVLLHHRIGKAAADQALDRKERVLGIGHRLAFRRLADQALARFGKCNHRGRRAHTLAILDHLGTLAFHHGNAGVRRAEIDTDDLAHGHLVLKQDRAARGSTVPIPREVITAIPSLWLGSIYVSRRAATTTLAVACEAKIHRVQAGSGGLGPPLATPTIAGRNRRS